MTDSFVAIDVETANPDQSSICQVGAVRVENGKVTDSFDCLVNPETYFDPWNVEIHGITESVVQGQPRFVDIAARLEDFVRSDTVVSHTSFDRVAIERAHERYSLAPPAWIWLDTARVARRAWTKFAKRGYGLRSVASHCGVEFRHHEAVEDARAAAMILLKASQDAGLDLQGWIARVRQPINPKTGNKKVQVSQKGDPEGPLAGEVVVFTGALSVPRVKVASRAASLGCDVRNAVSAKTTILVVGQQDLQKIGGYTKSSKHRRAEELVRKGASIAILGEDDFMRLAGAGGSRPLT